jgi:DNA-binding transcriptional LysR family regulator
LEEHLGTRLFERTPTGVRLTTAGHLYVESVREAFGKLAWASGGAAAPAKLRVSVPPTFARQLLIPRLPDFYRQWPDVEVEVHLSIPLLDVTAESADVEIRWGYGGYGDRQAIKLFEDWATPLAAPAYRDEVALTGPADLRRATLLRTPLMPWRPWFEAAGLDWPEPERGPLYNDVGMLLEGAAGGQGDALAISRVAAAWTDAGRLAPLFEVKAPWPLAYYVMPAGGRAGRPEVSAFLEWMTETFA